MKTIKLTEEQMQLFTMLIEDSAGAPNFDDGDVKEFADYSENGITSTVTDDEGNPEFGEMFPSEKIKMCPQNYLANSMNGGYTKTVGY